MVIAKLAPAPPQHGQEIESRIARRSASAMPVSASSASTWRRTAEWTGSAGSGDSASPPPPAGAAFRAARHKAR